MIVKLILKNYTPLSKKGVTYVELSTKDMFNIILGRNGFGKTSLLRELTPFPPDNADYLQGGYKEVHIVVGKDTYVLTSSTGKSSEHHFFHNGKELNEGNTLLVQRDLVKIHFGLTQNVKNIITGLDVRDLFSTLSAARRKDFLMSVNPNDTSYALKMFDKLKSNHNALKGGLKTQRQRLVVEEGRMAQLASMDPDKLQAEIRLLDDQIKNALIIHGELQHIHDEDIEPIRREIGNIVSNLIGANSFVKHSKGVLWNMREQFHGTLQYHKDREIKFSTMLTEFATQLAGFDSTNSDLDGYKQRLSNVASAIGEEETIRNRIIARFEENVEFPINHHTDKEMFNHFVQVSNSFVYQVQSVNRAVDSDITSAKFKQVQQKLVETTNEQDTVRRKISEIDHTLEHYNRADVVECPKCDAKFKPGFTKVNLVDIQNQRNLLVERSAVLKKQITEYSDYIDDNQGWHDSMTELLRFARNTPISEIFVKLIQIYRIGKADTSVLVSLAKDTSRLAACNENLIDLNNEKESVEKQIKFLETSDIETLIQRAAFVERELAASQRSIRRITNQISNVNEQLDMIQSDEFRRERLRDLTANLEETMVKKGQYRIKLRVQEVISDLTPRKDQLISGLIRAESLNSVIQSIKDNIIDLERREKHTLLLMEGLSPVKGLIGYLMNDFLKSVVANVNAIIQPIWTNRLHVLNCSTSKSDEDVDLSYNFPVLSGDSDKPNKDIGDCSGGEREIINFAFRLVLRRYQGERCSLPLMMDEVGVAFDELHRGRFAAYIAEQLRLDKLPQTFLISHYVNQYGAFNTANVIALNTEGLHIPGKVNTNSVLK